MAEPSNLQLSKEAQANIIAYANKILTAHKQFNQLHNKMEIIDQAYARFKATGLEEDAAVPCGDVFAKDDITPPIVVSQVDSLVAYWGEVFLSGYPMFPVVSTPAKRKWAEQLESLLDDHSTLGAYPRQLLLFFKDAAKYNFSALEADWTQISQYSVLGDFSAPGAQKVDVSPKYFTKLTRRDPYNVVWDYNVAPADVAAEGDYAGYIEILNRTKLKRLLNRYTASREVYNARQAEESAEGTVSAFSSYYREPPEISDVINSRKPFDQVDWEAYLQTGPARSKIRRAGKADNFEVFTFYARILPAEFGLQAPKPKHPQIWKFAIVNNQIVIHAKRIISAYDMLPMLFGQPNEDGLGVQTQSIGESVIDFQEAASTLYNIRFAAARRSVSDRALYDSDMINPKHINSKAPAPKIPVSIKGIQGRSIRDAYHQIPFDMRGTETTLQDAATINEFAKELTGLNNARRGQFQKGNKSVTEWNDVMGNSDGRTRLSALLLEHQIFVPLKFMLSLNVFQYGENTIVVSQKTGEVLEVDITELRKHTMSFRLADGYTPKSKLASMDMLQVGMQMLMSSEILQQSFGNMLPSMFAHMMQLGGVRGLEEYTPEAQRQATEEEPPAGLAEAPLGGQVQGQLPVAPNSPIGPGTELA